MKKIFPYGSLILLAVLVQFGAKAQFRVNVNTTATDLARILAGNGVQVFNAQFTGGRHAAGTFTNSNTNLGIDSGIILTNGLCKYQAPNAFGADTVSGRTASSNLNLPGDADLEKLIRNLAPTLDAAVLEFDFIPAGDTVNFRFVFASEEYPSYNCTPFSDIFAFFISGPGFPRPANIALVPGTQIPVAINSINNGIPGAGGSLANCALLGQGSPFKQYYVDNTNRPIVYNGMTVTLVAGAKVQPCRVYHLKLAIADLTDGVIDSGVFLEASSFSSTFATIQFDGSRNASNEPYIIEGCEPASMKFLFSRKVQSPTDLLVTVSGTADNDLDFSIPIPDFVTIPAGDSVVPYSLLAIQDLLPEGVEKVKITVAPLNCSDPVVTDSIEINIMEYLPIGVRPVSPVICEGESVSFSTVNTFLTNFNWSPALYLDNPNIPNPTSTPDTSIQYIITAGLTATCFGKDSIWIKVKDTSSVLYTKRDVGCTANSGEIRVFPGYGWDTPEFSINGGPWQSDSLFANLGAGTYKVTVRDATGCSASRTISIYQQPPLTIARISTETASCSGSGGSLTIHATGGAPPYSYSVTNTSFQADSLFPAAAGTYTVYVRDATGCSDSRSVTVGQDGPINFTLAVTADSCTGRPDGTITVTANGGSGNYSYSLDGTTYQPSNLLKAASGNYTVYVRDNKGCSAQQTVSVPLRNTLSLQMGSGATLCEGASLQLQPRSNAASFSWSPAAGLSDASVLQPIASPAATTTYTLQVRSGLCEASGQVTLTVNPAPLPNAGRDTSICFGTTATLNGNGGISYSWNPASSFANPAGRSQVVRPQATTTYWLHVEDANGCRSIRPDSITVTVLEPVVADAGADTIIAIGQPLQLEGAGSGTVFQWTPPAGLSNPSIRNPIALLNNHTTYTLKVTNSAGCSDEDAISIKVYKGNDIYVATAFTPNNDGRNDLLLAIPAGIATFKYFKVYNRWGELVFETSDFRKGWDGRIKGLPQETGTFIWMAEGIDYLGNKIFRKGTTTLMR